MRDADTLIAMASLTIGGTVLLTSCYELIASLMGW